MTRDADYWYCPYCGHRMTDAVRQCMPFAPCPRSGCVMALGDYTARTKEKLPGMSIAEEILDLISWREKSKEKKMLITKEMEGKTIETENGRREVLYVGKTAALVGGCDSGRPEQSVPLNLYDNLKVLVPVKRMAQAVMIRNDGRLYVSDNLYSSEQEAMDQLNSFCRAVVKFPANGWIEVPE